jgi:glycosyltransferase involved in cell wall biosynthesis
VVLSDYISHRNSSPEHLLMHPTAVFAAERRLRRIASSRPERLLLHREASPLSRGGLERRLLDAAEFAVYELDDALQWDWGEGSWFRRLAPKGPKAHIAVQHADRVVAGSPVLADWASDHNRDVVMIPSCVSPDAYLAKSNYELGDPPRLGWIGSRDNERYLLQIGPALREVQRRTGARITMIGTLAQTLGDLEGMIDRVRWSEAIQRDWLAGFDLGLAPLPDEPYTRGKCGYKLLQYGAAGTPAVGSPVGVNSEILAKFGMPAPANDADWVDAMMQLLSMPTEARTDLGRRAREIVRQQYSYDAWLAKRQQTLNP